MADSEDTRVKMCRYCDGLIAWGTEICPHCGEDLNVVEFDDMDFVEVHDGVVEGLNPGRDRPSHEKRRIVKPLPPTAEPPEVEPLPPVVQPLSDEGTPPLVQPLEGSGPAPGVVEIEDCAVCNTEIAGAEEIGGKCENCESTFCYGCLLRANGVRASTSMRTNRSRWEERLAQVQPGSVRCPVCGRKGVA